MASESTEALAVGELLNRSAFFSPLPPEAREELVARLERCEVPAGATVVREGEDGDRYYLIGTGEAEVWASKGTRGQEDAETRGAKDGWVPDPERGRLVARLRSGDGFGEMAILLGGPRQATVRAITDLVLYALDGATFTRVVNQHRGLAVAIEEEMALRAVSTFLGRSSPFANLSPEALRWLAVRLRPVPFDAGQEIVREGEPGDAFYLVRAGKLEVVGLRPDTQEYRIATLGPGQPFGEQALLTGEPRSATVRALGSGEVLRLSREDFETVLRRHPERRRYFLQLTLQRQRPRPIEHWAMERQETHPGRIVYVLKDTRNNYYVRLSEQGAFLWELMDGHRTVRDLTMAYFARYQAFGLDVVLAAMVQLHAAGFVRIQRVDSLWSGQVARPSPLQRLVLILAPWSTHYAALPDVSEAVTILYRCLLRPFFSRPAQGLLLVTTLVGAALFARYLGDGTVHPLASTTVESLAPALVLGFFLHICLHEVAHAATCKHFGREVHRAGIGWYFFMPVAFVDTSDIWMSGKGPRAAVAFAGPYANFVLAGFATLLTLPVGDAPTQVILTQFALMGYVLGITNLSPLMEFDGYYVLTDLLEVPNLRSKALAFLGTLLCRARRTTRDRRLERIFAVYGALTLLYTLLVAASVAVASQGYLRGLVGHGLPSPIAWSMGWGLAGAMAVLVLACRWPDLPGRCYACHRKRGEKSHGL